MLCPVGANRSFFRLKGLEFSEQKWWAKQNQNSSKLLFVVQPGSWLGRVINGRQVFVHLANLCEIVSFFVRTLIVVPVARQCPLCSIRNDAFDSHRLKVPSPPRSNGVDLTPVL